MDAVIDRPGCAMTVERRGKSCGARCLIRKSVSEALVGRVLSGLCDSVSDLALKLSDAVFDALMSDGPCDGARAGHDPRAPSARERRAACP